MAQKPRKVPLNKRAMKSHQLSKSLEKYGRKIRNAEEIDVTEMFMELAKSQRALEEKFEELKELIAKLTVD